MVIVFLIGFIIFCPFSIELEYRDEVKLKVGYIFPLIKILPKKSSTEEESEEETDTEESDTDESEEETAETEKTTGKKSKSRKKNKFREVWQFTKKQGLDGMIELLKDITALILKLVDTIRQHIVMKTRLDLVVVGEDAADTALKFGYACSAIYPLLSLIDRHTKLKKHEEYIDAGFKAEKTQVRFLLKAHIMPVFVIVGVVAALIDGIRIFRKIRQ